MEKSVVQQKNAYEKANTSYGEHISYQEQEILKRYGHVQQQTTDQTMLKAWRLARLYQQQYRIVGNHSVVKICHWTKKSMKNEGNCYKHYFYGVDTLRCLEMSPAITCNQRCKHCWRDTSVYSPAWVGPVDDPEYIVQESIAQRNQLLIGFKGNKAVLPQDFEQAIIPSHVAISLTGEPCMYPRISELIEAYFKKGVRTVFLVTSGTVPQAIKAIIERGAYPTNLYLSVEARNEEEYKALCIPVIPNAYTLVQESMKLLSTIPTRTVMRITCMKGLNMDDPEGFYPAIRLMNPDYIELKGYMFLGYSMLRMKKENMPRFEEVKAFAQAFIEGIDYQIVDEHAPSTIVLLKRKTPRKEYQDQLYLEKLV